MRHVHAFALVIAIGTAAFVALPSLAEEPHGATEHEEVEFRNLIRLMAGYSIVPDIESSSSNIVPALGFDYQRFVTGRLYVGTYNDLELTTYIIRADDGNFLEREYAFVSTVVVGYDFTPWFSAYAGPGYEFETHENFVVFRAGVEFMKELTDRYAIAVPVYYDHKEVYGAIGIGLAVARRF